MSDMSGTTGDAPQAPRPRPRPSGPRPPGARRGPRPPGAGQRPPRPRPEGARPPRPRPAAPRPPQRFGADLNRLLILAIIGTIVAILAMLGAALVFGDLGGTKAPRTYVERQISMLEAAVRTSPANGRAWAEFARALIDAGQYGRAEEAIKQGLIAAADDKGPVLVEQARLQYRQGDAKAALKTTDKAIAEARALRDNLVNEYRQKGIVMDPRAMPMDAIVSAGILESVIYKKLGKPADAADSLTIALGEKGNMADVLTERGLLYLELKRYDDARADLEKALTFIPDYAEAKAGIKKLEAVGK